MAFVAIPAAVFAGVAYFHHKFPDPNANYDDVDIVDWDSP